MDCPSRNDLNYEMLYLSIYNINASMHIDEIYTIIFTKTHVVAVLRAPAIVSITKPFNFVSQTQQNVLSLSDGLSRIRVQLGSIGDFV